MNRKLKIEQHEPFLIVRIELRTPTRLPYCAIKNY